jgi:secreted Zn-dependent insulinase-like peptidase
VKSSIDRRTEPDKDLAVEVTRNWSEIASGRLQFDRIQKEAAALLGVEKKDILDFWKTLYSGDGRRVLITEMIPKQGVAASQLPLTSTGYEAADLTSEGLVIGIDDIKNFRRDRETLTENQILS